MSNISIQDMIDSSNSRYALVIAVAKRARQITQSYIDSETILEGKPVLMAIEEFKAHKFNIIEPENGNK